MRSQLWLLAASGHLATADWAWGQGLEAAGVMLPRETRASGHDGANGWTPKPTKGPSVELARRRQDRMNKKRQDDNPWLDESTCGWRANTESEPFVCEEDHTCSTNTDNVVGCTSEDGESPWFTVCLDFNAVQASACDGAGTKTGCCKTRTIGECLTYLWPGSTMKSMFRCGPERTVITMLSEPFFSTTSTTSSSTTTTSEASTTTDDSSPVESTSGVPPPPVAEEDGNDIGAIVGGVVGGVAGLALIAGAVAFFMIRQRKKEKAAGAGTAYSAVAPGDQGYQGGPPPAGGYPASSISPQMSQAGYFSPGTVGTTLRPESPYLHGTTPPPPVAGMYDPRQTYYDPAKPQHQHAYMTPQSGYAAPYPGAPPPQEGYPKPYPGQPQPVSELENTPAPAGHQTNPIEMAASGPHAEMR